MIDFRHKFITFDSSVPMKRNYIIASLVVLTAFATSCQKDEFEEAYDEAAAKTAVARSVEDEPITGSSGNSVNDNKPFIDPIAETEASDLILEDDPVGVINISIKEVSDGDDESDGGDDSRENIK